MTTVTILGAGVMGTAMVLPFHDRGMTVRLVGTHLDGAIIESVRARRHHPKLNVTLPASVQVFTEDQFAQTLADDTDFVLLGVSSAGVSWAIEKLAKALKRPIPIVMITKGMAPEASNLGALPDLLQNKLREARSFTVPVAAIGGPCIAGELAVRRQTGTVIVAHDRRMAEDFCQRFETEYYHPRPSTDMMGVEVCAAFKNFFAIAVGWAHGRMEVLPEAENKARNNNAAAILFDQAILEMLALSSALGGLPESVWGMPGAGDLYVTCQAGRNSRLGNHLGRGLSYSQVKSGPMKDDTIEGAELGRAVASSIHAMVKDGKLRASRIPLTLALLDVLTGDKPFEPPWPQFARSA